MQRPQGAGPMEQPDPEGAMPDREDLRDLQAVLRPAIRVLLGACPGACQVRLTATAFNLKRANRLLLTTAA